MNSPTPVDLVAIETEVESSFSAAVGEALKTIDRHAKSGGTFFSEFEWIEMDHWRNGMPWFKKSDNAPINYATPFIPAGPLGKSADPADSTASFMALERLLTTNPFLRERILPKWNLGDTNPESGITSSMIFAARFAAKALANRYVHLFGNAQFDNTNFKSIYSQLRNAVFNEKLLVDVCIPILFVKFSFDELRIDENARIVRMDDDFQISRGLRRSVGIGSHEMVYSCATHMLVLENWEVTNRNRFELYRVFAARDNYPLSHIERFFAALRATTAVPTGYTQLLLRPLGWAYDWSAQLRTHLYGTTLRAYPGTFEDFYWTSDSLPVLSVKEATTCGSAYRGLIEAKENSLSIAVKRLNSCYCREDEEDWLIDATIALEALLSDGNQEMTHKLALRVAAISQFYPGQQKGAEQIFEEVKRIYKERSSIVHGKSRTSKQEQELSATAPTVSDVEEMAREHLRTVLRVLIEHPEYRSPKTIDQLLLRGVNLRIG